MRHKESALRAKAACAACGRRGRRSPSGSAPRCWPCRATSRWWRCCRLLAARTRRMPHCPAGASHRRARQPGEGPAQPRAAGDWVWSSALPSSCTRSESARRPRGAIAAPVFVSVCYLALLSPEHCHGRGGPSWRSWYEFLPWEDWRRGRPACLPSSIEPLAEGLGRTATRPTRHQRLARPAPAAAPSLRLRRRCLGRGEGAGALRANVRGGPRRGSR